jgi:hypothetical protein
MNPENLKICRRCILPETFPGIRFDEQGICNHCHGKLQQKENLEKKSLYTEKFEALIQEIKGRAPVYDVVMAFSGGKDSSYTLKLLKEKYNLRILALTYNNHFISDRALKNIEAVTRFLEIDSIIFTVPWEKTKKVFKLTAEKDIFPKATLLRASSICTACISIVKNTVLKTALEMSIPLVAYGWSPGQAPIQSSIMQTNPSLFKQAQDVILNSYPEDIRCEMAHYFIPDAYYLKFEKSFPVNIHPLAFFKYDEDEILQDLSVIGWQLPVDTDSNSSNCLLNAFANQCHIKRFGFHPYVWENANMVRQGIMERDIGLEKIYLKQDTEQVDYAKERLGLWKK